LIDALADSGSDSSYSSFSVLHPGSKYRLYRHLGLQNLRVVVSDVYLLVENDSVLLLRRHDQMRLVGLSDRSERARSRGEVVESGKSGDEEGLC